MSAYTIQPFTPDSYPLMKELFQASFGTGLEEAAFKKKYSTGGLGHEVIGFLAVHAPTQTPAAFYGVFPVNVLVDNKELLAAQSGDTMTHPAHQKKGLFVQLAEMTYEACRKAGIGLVFGQPNKNSYHGLVNRLHFIHLDDVEQYNLKPPVKTLPLPKLLKRIGQEDKFLRFAKKLLHKWIAPDVQAFTNPLQTDYGKIVRNNAYLRYKDEPDKLFLRIDGAVFWLKLTDVLWIGDVSRYEDVTPAVLNKLQRLAFALGYNTVRFQWNRSLPKPAFLQRFRRTASEASCFLYLHKELEGRNFILTGADFDTW